MDEIVPPPRPGGKPTLRTIAELTGLAVTTVSRALAGDPRIAAGTRALVAEAAAKVAYVPDRAAQRLRTGRTKVVQLLLNLDHEFLGFTHDLIGGISEALKGTGYSVTIFPDFLQSDRLATMAQIVQNRLADGVIFNRTEPFDPRVRFLTEHGFPFVCHGRTEFSTPHPFVDYDNEAFARAAVNRLVARGRRRLAMVLPKPRYTFAQHLRYGFLSAAREAGVGHETPGDIHLDSAPGEISAWVRARLAHADGPDGFVCVGEVASIATLAALADCGIAPGGTVDVVAKRASSIFTLMRPQVDTVFEDLWATGNAMGRVLLGRMRGEDAADLQVLQSPVIEFRD